jgi:uncharacterized glyoxalase superfamily protein PhnB
VPPASPSRPGAEDAPARGPLTAVQQLSESGWHDRGEPAAPVGQIDHLARPRCVSGDRRELLTASDLAPGMEHKPGENISISLSGDDADELRGYWEKLSASGTRRSTTRSAQGSQQAATSEHLAGR